MDNLFICPKCKCKLSKIDNSYKCENNHSFDISRKGYINLLLNNDKSSINPGDTKISLDSRNSFLNQGYYSSILEGVTLAIESKKGLNGLNLLDIGCGEGFYTSSIYNKLTNSNVYGFDIAKDGINIATRYTKDVNWFVANSKNIPVMDNSIDVVLAIFSFVTDSEIERVLKDDGIIVQVVALDDHLKEIKEMFYESINKKDINNKLLSFNLIESKEINTKVVVKGSDNILNLFKMTPHYYRVKSDKKNVFDNVVKKEITINVMINIYKK